MHEPVISHLEEVIERGSVPAPVEQHLAGCAACRKEVTEMQSQAAQFHLLHASSTAEPSAGFYARVMNRIEAQGRPSMWNLFGESLFAKRLAYSSITLLVLLGTYFISSSAEPGGSTAPELILASEDQSMPEMDAERGRDAVLVNLATYSSSD